MPSSYVFIVIDARDGEWSGVARPLRGCMDVTDPPARDSLDGMASDDGDFKLRISHEIWGLLFHAITCLRHAR